MEIADGLQVGFTELRLQKTREKKYCIYLTDNQYHRIEISQPQRRARYPQPFNFGYSGSG